ncbi:SPW repeat domain-containing protein [Sandaracinus amylolyticus]|uniref:SPW repeat domain-containing protein n=1 Tax=Sandaracinus amylolyticus TaxID=927083 RepID=UPI001F30ED63|nr:vitamin K epoxide reductase [Sandaracinus amylolyticus]UJR83596.1 Hypothetical protein I5071_56640 [Sandaracinus amylolyticus]
MSEHEHEESRRAARRSVTRSDESTLGSARRRRIREEQHARTLWASYALLLVGVWLMIAPLAFGEEVLVDTARASWLSSSARATIARWNEVLCGAVLTLAAWRMLEPHRAIARRIVLAVGVWLSLSPVVLAAPSASIYANDTLIGMLVVALGALVPGAIDEGIFAKSSAAAVPPGWSYDPSSWPQRVVTIVLALAAFLVARSLAAFQLGYDERAWEPFFVRQTESATDAAASSPWMISDAALAAFVFTFVMLVAFVSGPARWRTAPWVVVLQGVLVIPLGLAHVAITLVHSVTSEGWSTPRLVSAALALVMIALVGDEVIAAFQHLARVRAGAIEEPLREGRDDARTPDLAEVRERPSEVVKASLWGASATWNLLASVLLGALVMMLPALIGLDGAAADALHVGGALAIVFALIATGEVFRAVRYANVVVGAVIAILPIVLGVHATDARILGIALGVGVALLALPRTGPVERYGAWDRFVV